MGNSHTYWKWNKKTDRNIYENRRDIKIKQQEDEQLSKILKKSLQKILYIFHWMKKTNIMKNNYTMKRIKHLKKNHQVFFFKYYIKVQEDKVNYQRNLMESQNDVHKEKQLWEKSFQKGKEVWPNFKHGTCTSL